MSPAATDTLALLLPPAELCNWLATVIAKRLQAGERVPEAYKRWLYRVQMTRLGMPGPEVMGLTDEEWAEIGTVLRDSEQEEVTA